MSARNIVRDLRENGALQSKPPSSGWLTPILLTVIAASVGVAIAYAGTKFIMPQLGPARMVALADPSPVGAATHTGLAFEDTRPFGDADVAACKRLGLAAVRRFEALNDEEGDINMFASNNGTKQIVLMSTQLVCEAQTRPLRFCDPAERTKLVDHTSPYLTTLFALNAMLGLSAASPGLVLAGPDNMVSGMIEDGAKEVRGLNAKVVAAFRQLATRGLLSEADFGGFLGAPAELKPAFANLESVRPACGPASR